MELVTGAVPDSSRSFLLDFLLHSDSFVSRTASAYHSSYIFESCMHCLNGAVVVVHTPQPKMRVRRIIAVYSVNFVYWNLSSYGNVNKSSEI